MNQILTHIANTPLALLDYCRERDILCEAYSPIAHGEALKLPAVTTIAQRYGVTRRSCASAMCCSWVWSLWQRPQTRSIWLPMPPWISSYPMPI